VKLFTRLFGLVLALLVALLAVQWFASESGEVVVVATHAGDGSVAETRLWVVDLDNSAWLRAGSPDAGWYARLVADPAFTVTRNGTAGAFRAVPEPGRRAEINDLISAKYGWADAFIGALFDRSGAVPLRLEPAS
jgi:hypothetical protein